MTQLQQNILAWLLTGGSIAGNDKYGFRLRDEKNNVIHKFSSRTFACIKEYTRREHGVFVANKKYIRSLSRRWWVKQEYLRLLKASKAK